MNARADETVFRIRDFAGGRSEFMWDEDVAEIEAVLLKRMEALGSGRTLVVDFEGVSMSSDAVRRLLKRTIQRVRRGEWDDRSLVIDRLGRGLYNVKVMLLSERLAVVARGIDGSVALLGDVEPSLATTYQFIATQSSVTTRDVQRAFDLNTVAAATNRLVRLAQLGAVRRVGQEPVEGGGLQYRYAAVR